MLGFVVSSFSEESVRHVAGTAMGMKWSVKWIGGQEGAVIQQDIAGLLTEIEKEMSTYRADSEISRFNVSRSTNWFPVSTNLMRAVAASLELAVKTEGALDPAVYPLVQAWGFGPIRRVGQMPTVTEIAIARTKVGHTNVQVRASPPAVRKLRPFVSLDVNAVAMGLAADLAKARLQQLGCANFLIDMGGEFAAVGDGPEGKGWPVGIEQPDSQGRRIQRVIVLRNESLATSGDDRNFREINGKRYHHIIDPRTGWPAETQIASATVIHSSCTQADGWATAMVVMGAERGLAVAEREGFNVVLIIRGKDGQYEVKETGHGGK
ncbi:MAG: ApbE family lipoprotein [Verrucomicrobia bacterium]|nr:ApbE family lipoprotein [Verrucomicrobiota bacterium]